MKIFLMFSSVCFSKWWPVAESNHGHSDFQSLALPTELTGHFVEVAKLYFFTTESKLISLETLLFCFFQALSLYRVLHQPL